LSPKEDAMQESRKNILVIEPDPCVRSILCSLLRKRNCRVRTGADFAEALRSVRERRFECLIIDADTDGVRGTDALERLRLVDPIVKVLLVSRKLEEPPVPARDDRTYFCYVSAASLADASLL
jgi:DNA-binding response OmpR family regulator